MSAPRPACLGVVETPDIKVQTEVAPRVWAFGAVRPMNRIRAYSSAGLSPFAGRGTPKEFQLFGHLHLDEAGKVVRIEGFNGNEGEAWAKQAKERLAKADALAEKAVVQPVTPLKHCPHTGVR